MNEEIRKKVYEDVAKMQAVIKAKREAAKREAEAKRLEVEAKGEKS